MPEKDQFGIYTKDQLALIKQTFAANDTLLYTIRKVFLQFPLTEVEKGLIRTTITDPIYEILKIRLLPDLSPTFPLTQIPSILTTLTGDLKTKEVDQMVPQFEAKQLEIDYLNQQFRKLKDLDAPEPIKLADLAVIKTHPRAEASWTNFVNMTAYLFLLGYIDPTLQMLKVIAGEKNETPEQQEKRLKRDSSQ